MVPLQFEYTAMQFVVGNRETGQFYQTPTSPHYPLGPFETAHLYRNREAAEQTLRAYPWSAAEIIPVQICF